MAAGVTVDTYLPSALPRTAVPWDDVGEGWYAVLFDSSKADPAHESEVREGAVVLYLVDSDGTRYEAAAWTDGVFRPWQLLDAQGTSVLVAGSAPGVDEQEWQMVDMTAGMTTVVHAAGFPEYTYSAGPAAGLTRPTGANVVLHRSDGVDEWLERRSPAGALLATVYTQSFTDEQSSLLWMYGYEGTSLLVTHHGGIALVSNTGGLLAELWVPPDRRCEPVRWWDSDTFLAACYGRGPASAPPDEYGNPHTYYGQLWLLETDGTAGFAVTELPTDPVFVVDFGYRDAWPSGATTYLQWSGDCGAAAVRTLQPDGSGSPLPISIPSSIVADGVALIDNVDAQLTFYGWQGCAGDIGVLFATDLTGAYLHDLVPVVGDARSVIGVKGLATVYP